MWIPVKSGKYEVYVVAKNQKGDSKKSNEITLQISELTRKVEGTTFDYNTTWQEVDGNIEDKKSIAYFKESVVKNSGFYMGRYEMGMPGQKSGDAPVLELDYNSRNVRGVPVCVGQVIPWTYIDWSTAKANLESMYKGEAQSAMMNSYARITMLNWFIKTGAITRTDSELGNYNNSSFIFKGYYYRDYYYHPTIQYAQNHIEKLTGTATTGEDTYLIETGAETQVTDRHSINHIYDLAGNAGEWTTEQHKILEGNYRISGGSCENASYSRPLVDNNASLISYGVQGQIEVSSRPILYK